jgi:exonuclease SbcD
VAIIPFSFVHAADVHLDSPFKGITADAPEIAEVLRRATFDSFNTLVDLCLERRVQFLLLAGDIFDWADRSLRAQLFLRDGLARLGEGGIHSYLVFGNHDPFAGRTLPIEWPDSVHIFGWKEVETCTAFWDGRPIASVSGLSYGKQREGRNLARKYRRGPADLFSIGVLHCNVGSETGHEPYAPCELSDLVETGMDYWALGHVHQRRILGTDPSIVYSGNTQGRSFREQGERGCFCVSVDKEGALDLEFCPLDAVRWSSGSVDIGGLGSFDLLDRAVTNLVEALAGTADGRPLVCRVALTGRGPLYSELQREGVVAELLERVRESFSSEDPFVWLQDLCLECLPEMDIVRRREIRDLLGEVLRGAHAIRESGEGDMRAILTEALSDLYANRRVARALGPLSDAELADMLTQAEFLCIHKLSGDGA